MKRKDKIMQDCRNKVAESMRYKNWYELIRFKPRQTQSRINKVLESTFNKEMPMQFAGWWVLKRNKLEDFRPFPEKEHLEEFLNEEV